MRWESGQASSGNEVYHLYKDDNKILSLTVNPFSKTARVECNQQKRIFLVRKEGFLRNKTVIRNEYGIKVGELGHENKDPFIDVNDERFYYTIQNQSHPELALYKESKDKPVFSCGLSLKDGNSTVKLSKDHNIQDSSHPELLIAMCWYMFLPVAKENLVEA